MKTPDTEMAPAGHEGHTENQMSRLPAPASANESMTLALARRTKAASRLPALPCGCRDPWSCACIRRPLTSQALDGWGDAAGQILAAGHTPMVPIEAMRALWRRGGADRDLVRRLSALSGEVAA